MNTYHLRYEIRIEDSESIEADSFSDAMYKLTKKVKKSFGRGAEIKIESYELEAEAKGERE